MSFDVWTCSCLTTMVLYTVYSFCLYIFVYSMCSFCIYRVAVSLLQRHLSRVVAHRCTVHFEWFFSTVPAVCFVPVICVYQTAVDSVHQPSSVLTHQLTLFSVSISVSAVSGRSGSVVGAIYTTVVQSLRALTRRSSSTSLAAAAALAETAATVTLCL
jgi:hypothetical protein